MNHTHKVVKKCLGCRCLRLEDEFVYGNKINKSCLKCRNKRKNNRAPKTNTNNETNTTNKDNDLTRYIRHQKVFKKLNNEFLEKAGKKVHKYHMKYIFIDIKDHRIYSDKEFSHIN